MNSTVQTSTVSTASGECRLTNVTAKGKIQLQTSSGDIQLFGDTAQTLTVSSSSGVCTLFYVTAKGEVQLQTSSGDVTLQNCDAGSLDIRTSSGNVTGTLRGDMKYDAQTQSGDVQVPVSGSAGMCTVRTSSGDINFS